MYKNISLNHRKQLKITAIVNRHYIFEQDLPKQLLQEHFR